MKRPLHAGLQAWAARLLMRACARLLAGPQAHWARAMQAEVEALSALSATSATSANGEAGDEHAALAYAWGCLRAALGHALGRALAQTLVPALARLAQPATAGVLAGTAAVLLGCLFMWHAGAPGAYVVMNLLSLALAAATFGLLPRRRLQQDGLLRGRLAAALGGGLLLPSLLGAGLGGASPWLHIGPVGVQLTWLLLPALLVASDVGPQAEARRWAGCGLLIALGALALQAEAPLAGLVAAFFALRAWRQRSRAAAGLALLAGAVAWQAAPRWSAADTLPFVDQVLQQGYAQHLAAGLGLTLALLLPFAPALLQRQARESGALWGLWLLLSLPGWLPSPLVGFGGSFIVGHLLSLALLPSGCTDEGGPAPPIPLTPHSGPARA